MRVDKVESATNPRKERRSYCVWARAAHSHELPVASGNFRLRQVGPTRDVAVLPPLLPKIYFRRLSLPPLLLLRLRLRRFLPAPPPPPPPPPPPRTCAASLLNTRQPSRSPECPSFFPPEGLFSVSLVSPAGSGARRGEFPAAVPVRSRPE
jgi:hypothetical protein